jgi:catechol 2,3-dioxygenase-like lactoylglutathione lyase family enzyme
MQEDASVTDKPIIAGLAHVCFVVADLERSTSFYCETLGLQRAFSFVNDQGVVFGHYIHLGGRQFIELFQRELAARADGQSYQHLCLEVENLSHTVTTLRQRGVDCTEPKLGSDNAWQAWIQDPDGNRIELHQYTPEAKQMAWLS